MGYNDLSEMQLLTLIETARKDTEYQLLHSSITSVDEVLGRNINSRFSIYNNESKLFYCDTVNIKLTEIVKEHDFKKAEVGGGLIALGAPILKKRFVTQGSSIGTSIASKYLSKALPQKMPFKMYSINMSGRIVSTNVLGRGIGRLIPYVGWGLLAIDVIELLVEVFEKELTHKSFRGGGGGRSGGGGASRSW